METEEQGPEMNLAKTLIEHLSGHLWPPEVETTEHRKDHGSEDHVMEVRYDEI